MIITIKQFSSWLSLVYVFALYIIFGLGQAMASEPDTLHMHMISAPVVSNGVVASEPSEFNLLIRRDGTDLVTAMDADVKGPQIPAGGKMQVELSGFVVNQDLGTFFKGRNVILTTGPQNPIKPNTELVSGGNWNASFDTSGINPVITITPNGGSGANGLAGTRAAALGFKVVHVRPDSRNRSHSGTPLYNGLPGRVGTIYVRVYNSSSTVVAAGSTSFRFLPRIGQQVHLSNARTRDDNSVNSNTNFQHVAINTIMDGTIIPSGGSFADGAPYAPQFMIFDDFGVHDQNQYPTGNDRPTAGDESFINFPGIDGVTVVPSTGDPGMAQLMQYGVVNVGSVVMKGPTKDSGGEVLTNAVATTAIDNGSILYVPVKVGTVTGLYTVTVYMNGGGSASNTIVVEH